MTKVTFHNEYNPDVIYSEDAFKSNIGKEILLTNTANGETGTALITAVEVDDTGITISYETDMNLGFRLDNFSVEADDLQIVVPISLDLPDEQG